MRLGSEGNRTLVISKKGRVQRDVRWEDLITVFVDYLLESTTADQLRSAFSPFRMVVDSFILDYGRKGQGRCFGFVQFREREEAMCAVKSLDGSYLGGRRIAVNIAKYGWNAKKSVGNIILKNTSKLGGVPLSSSVVGLSDAFVEGSQGRSFASVVRRIGRSSTESISILRETIIKNANWLSNSMVGIIRWEGIIPSIPGLCRACGIEGIKVARLGGLKVLLSFINLEDSLAIIRAFKFDFDQIFSRLDKWVPERPCSSRVVWVRCYGLPLSGWDKAVF